MTTIAAPTATTIAPPRHARTGLVISALAGLFLLIDAVIHILAIDPVVESFRQLGFADSAALPIGLLELALVALYAIPRTSILGALLLTGYLGGAVSAHVRVDSPMFSTTLFPVYLGIALWVGLYLRNAKVRGLLTN